VLERQLLRHSRYAGSLHAVKQALIAFVYYCVSSPFGKRLSGMPLVQCLEIFVARGDFI
jgi:hypothetical protein